MSALHDGWAASCWLPWWAQVLLCVVAFFVFVVGWCALFSAGARCDVLQKDQERERVRDAFQQFTSTPGGESGERAAQVTAQDRVALLAVTKPDPARRESSERVADRRGVASRDALGVRPYKPGIAK